MTYLKNLPGQSILKPIDALKQAKLYGPSDYTKNIIKQSPDLFFQYCIYVDTKCIEECFYLFVEKSLSIINFINRIDDKIILENITKEELWAYVKFSNSFDSCLFEGKVNYFKNLDGNCLYYLIHKNLFSKQYISSFINQDNAWCLFSQMIDNQIYPEYLINIYELFDNYILSQVCKIGLNYEAEYLQRRLTGTYYEDFLKYLPSSTINIYR